MLRRTVLGLPLVVAAAMAMPAAAAQAEPSALAVPGDVHFAMTTGRGEVAHTIRRADGSWYAFANVPYAPVAHASTALASAIVNGEEHLMQQYYFGMGPYQQGLRHVIRHADGSWSQVTPPPDTQNTTTFVIASAGGELHRVRKTGTSLEHTVRHADGTWSSPTAITAQATGDTRLALAANGGELRLLVLNASDGTALSSFVRHGDGTWEQTPALPFAPATGVTATGVAIAQVGTELHAAVTGSDGAAYHAVLRSTGWTAFNDISSQTGAPGGRVSSLAVTAAGGALHLAVATSENRLLHTIRFPDGRWLPFGDVKAATGSPNVPLGTLALAGS